MGDIRQECTRVDYLGSTQAEKNSRIVTMAGSNRDLVSKCPEARQLERLANTHAALCHVSESLAAIATYSIDNYVMSICPGHFHIMIEELRTAAASRCLPLPSSSSTRSNCLDIPPLQPAFNPLVYAVYGQ